MVSGINSGSTATTSTSSSQPPITFGGLASGLNTNAIINALLAQAKQPITLLQQQEAVYQQQQATWQQLKSDFSNLLADAQALTDPTTFNAPSTTVLPSTTDTGKVDASATSSATPGSFTVSVSAMATATQVASTTGVGQAVNQTAPLDQAGFETAVTAGTFTIDGQVFTIPSATATSITSSGAVGTSVDPTKVLSSAGLTTTPVSGTFTINGTAITFDTSTDSINDIVSRINASSAGVTAAFDTSTNTITLTNNTAGSSGITLADTSGNFLQSMNLIDGTGATTGTVTSGTNMMSLTDVVNMINSSGIGVTASVVNDSYGRANELQLTGSSNVLLGSGADTSNFLSATNLLQSPSGTTRTSTNPIAGVDPTVDLQNADLATSLSASSGTFTINGVSFSWNAASDSLNNLISDINSSSAGVTAAYDPTTDKITLTSRTLGSSQISLADTSGNFLAATDLLGATQTTGTNAAYSINGGSTQYATSNTVDNAVPGVNLTFHGTTTSPVTVEVNADATSATKAIQAFVDQYNTTMADVATATKYDSTGQGQNGPLFGDTTVQIFSNTLHEMLTGQVLGFTGSLQTLNDVGLSFGAPGTALDQTTKLQFDSSKFTAAYQADPNAVVNLFTSFAGSVSLDSGGTGSVASLSGSPTSATQAGTYSIASTATGDLTVTFTPQDGSTPIVTTGTISAGGTNTALIPGVTITAKGTLVAGTDTATLTATQQGAGLALSSYIDSLTRTNGVFDTQNSSLQTTIDNINSQISDMNQRISDEQQSLIQQYSQLEVTISKLQSQQSALNGMLTQLGMAASGSSTSSSSSSSSGSTSTLG